MKWNHTLRNFATKKLFAKVHEGDNGLWVPKKKPIESINDYEQIKKYT